MVHVGVLPSEPAGRPPRCHRASARRPPGCVAPLTQRPIPRRRLAGRGRGPYHRRPCPRSSPTSRRARRPHHAEPPGGPQRRQRRRRQRARGGDRPARGRRRRLGRHPRRPTPRARSGPVFCAGADLKAVNAGDDAASAPSAAASPGSSTASAASRSSSPSTGWPRPAAARSCSPPTSSSPPPARRSASPRSSATSIAGAGGLFRLPRAIGQAAAMEAILTGEPIPAQRAYDLGLVSRLVEPGQAVAEARAPRRPDLPERPAGRLGEPRRRARRGVRGRRDAEEDDQRRRWPRVMGSEDLKEGLTAFIEKRPPAGRAAEPTAQSQRGARR